MRGVRNTTDGIRVVPTEVDPTGKVRVTVATSGICGSDVHLISYGPTAVTLGHECAGRLDDGTPVAVLPPVACGTCPRCRAGQEQQCPEAFGALYGITLDGGMADEIWVDPRNATPLDPALPLEQANLVEPLAVALHGANRAGVVDGSRVLVIGAGPIGLCSIAAARALGATVDLQARRPRRIEAGERLGAGTAVGSDYDVVLEAGGTQGSLDDAVRLVAPGGTVGVVGSYWDPVQIGIGFQAKEVSLVPAFTYGHHHGVSEFEEAARLLTGLPDLAGAVVTHRFGLDDAAEAFRVAGDRSEDAIKVVLVP
jgi:threonine dehydrogenase-like Zn-dependent dehydrogenase